MIEVPIEDLLAQTGSIFKLVVLAAKRTAELNDGFKAKIEVPQSKKLAAVALQEIAEGKIEFEPEE